MQYFQDVPLGGREGGLDESGAAARPVVGGVGAGARCACDGWAGGQYSAGSVSPLRAARPEDEEGERLRSVERENLLLLAGVGRK